MPAMRRVKGGRVAGLYVGNSIGAGKVAVSEMRLTLNGIDDDAHAGMVRAADARDPGFRRGTPLANVRQVSLVSVEELAEIAKRLEIDRIDPAWLAANMAVEGAGPITQWQRGTVLRFPSGAAIYITDLNTPCRLAAKLIAKHGGYRDHDLAGFVPSALGRRGLVGIVYAAGDIRSGDAIERLERRPELPSTQ
jgi:MOSC domain-containing protein YiiM